MAIIKGNKKDFEVMLPELDYINTLESKLKKGNKVFLDTNFFIPPLYSLGKHKFQENTILKYFLTCYAVKEQFRDIEMEIRNYQKKYCGRMSKLLKKYSNLHTIDRVVIELENCKQFFLDASRWSNKGFRTTQKRDSQRLRAFDATKKITKEKTNEIEKCLKLVYQKAIFKEACFGKKEFYDHLFSIIEAKRIEEDIPTNNYNTDQHILANACYLSALSGEHIDIFTFDIHLNKLLIKSKWDLIYAIKDKYDKLEVSSHRVTFGKNGANIVEAKIYK